MCLSHTGTHSSYHLEGKYATGLEWDRPSDLSSTVSAVLRHTTNRIISNTATSENPKSYLLVPVLVILVVHLCLTRRYLQISTVYEWIKSRLPEPEPEPNPNLLYVHSFLHEANLPYAPS
ncbi:hypothetical protein ILUMI_07181 [Ignelater luminosus]|uniref:Uncharacterized protein n=1 Tax=Ignelater luminosus TaxID=2038154 RepID=A0A8K0GGJ6_IGNLU|nr:hypothetical protein ILUMI_07181 [Ignelater luminosus]